MKKNVLKKILITVFLMAAVVFGFLIPYYSHPKVADGYMEMKGEIKEEIVKETTKETKSEEVINNDKGEDKVKFSDNNSDNNKETDNNIQLVENEFLAEKVPKEVPEAKEKKEIIEQDKKKDLHNNKDVENDKNEKIESSEENEITNNGESQEFKTLDGVVSPVKEEENVKEEIIYSEDWVEQKINENRDAIDDADLNDFRTIIGKLDMDYISKLSENLGTEEGELEFKGYLHSRLTDTEYSRSKELFIKYRDILFD